MALRGCTKALCLLLCLLFLQEAYAMHIKAGNSNSDLEEIDLLLKLRGLTELLATEKEELRELIAKKESDIDDRAVQKKDAAVGGDMLRSSNSYLCDTLCVTLGFRSKRSMNKRLTPAQLTAIQQACASRCSKR